MIPESTFNYPQGNKDYTQTTTKKDSILTHIQKKHIHKNKYTTHPGIFPTNQRDFTKKLRLKKKRFSAPNKSDGGLAPHLSHNSLNPTLKDIETNKSQQNTSDLSTNNITPSSIIETSQFAPLELFIEIPEYDFSVNQDFQQEEKIRNCLYEYLQTMNLSYDKQNPLGNGAYSTVYRLQNFSTKLPEDKVLKILQLKDPSGKTPKYNQNRGELVLLDSKHIPKAEQFFYFHNNTISTTAEPGAALVAVIMPYIEGTTLDRIIAQFQNKQEIIDVIRQIAHGLHDLHASQIVHRDIKPSNIMVKETNNNKEVYIIDMGISKKYDGLDGFETPSGTNQYKAPELHSIYYSITNQSEIGKLDVFSLGIIFYQLCTKGNRPTGCQSEGSFPFGVAEEEIDQNIPKEFQNALKNMLNANPKERWSIDNVLQFCDEYMQQPTH